MRNNVIAITTFVARIASSLGCPVNTVTAPRRRIRTAASLPYCQWAKYSRTSERQQHCARQMSESHLRPAFDMLTTYEPPPSTLLADAYERQHRSPSDNGLNTLTRRNGSNNARDR